MHQFVVYLAITIIRVLEFLFLARAIFSWFPQGRDSKIGEFLYMLTEPIIQPFRSLLNRFRALQGVPFDPAFFISFLVLEILLTILYQL